jgi:hypothetical protein
MFIQERFDGILDLDLGIYITRLKLTFSMMTFGRLQEVWRLGGHWDFYLLSMNHSHNKLHPC